MHRITALSELNLNRPFVHDGSEKDMSVSDRTEALKTFKLQLGSLLVGRCEPPYLQLPPCHITIAGYTTIRRTDGFWGAIIPKAFSGRKLDVSTMVSRSGYLLLAAGLYAQGMEQTPEVDQIVEQGLGDQDAGDRRCGCVTAPLRVSTHTAQYRKTVQSDITDYGFETDYKPNPQHPFDELYGVTRMDNILYAGPPLTSDEYAASIQQAMEARENGDPDSARETLRMEYEQGWNLMPVGASEISSVVDFVIATELPRELQLL